MDDRRRTLAAITVIIGFLVLVALVVGILVSGRKILSPVPEDDAIKIIFVSPTQIATPTSTGTPTPTPRVVTTKAPTATPKSTTGTTTTPTKTPTPTANVTASPTKTPTPTP